MTGVLIKNVKKSYGDVHVIHDLSVEIRNGEFWSLWGLLVAESLLF